MNTNLVKSKLWHLKHKTLWHLNSKKIKLNINYSHSKTIILLCISLSYCLLYPFWEKKTMK